jgi:hypothetical protein
MGAKLRDIKGIVEVSDFSMYYLVALSVLVLVCIIVLVYYLMQPKKRKKPTNKDNALSNLKNIDFKDAKDIAYTFSLNIPYFINENNQSKIEKVLEELEIFKYKKDVPQMQDDFKNEIKEIIKGVK